MILVDSRVGSKELVTPLKRLSLPAEEVTLEFGDVAFEGRGEQGRPVSIGIEFKQIDELIQSLRTGRLAGHQLMGMRGGETPLYDWAWLVVEGEWKADRAGQVLIQNKRGRWKPAHGQMTVGELDKQLLTLELRGGLHIVHTKNRQRTLRFLAHLYRWWTDCDLDTHKSHLTIYHSPTLVPISDFRRVISGLPDVGLRFSLAAQKKFGSIRRAVNAHTRDWAALETVDDRGRTRKLGEKVASRVDNVLEKDYR